MNTETKLNWLLGCTFAFAFLFLVFYFALSEKPVVRYNLVGYSSGLSIQVDVENACDTNIPLIGVSYDHAVAIVDSLNAELQKHPRQE